MKVLSILITIISVYSNSAPPTPSVQEAQVSVHEMLSWRGQISKFHYNPDTASCKTIIKVNHANNIIIRRYDFLLQPYSHGAPEEMVACATFTPDKTSNWEFFPMSVVENA